MMYQTGTSGPEAARLEDYLRAVQRHKWVVLALTALCVAVALLYTTARTHTYTSTATILLRPTPGPNNTQVLPNLEREREVLASNQTATAVQAQLGTAATPNELLKNLTVQFRPDSDVMQASFTATDATTAAVTAEAFAENYVDKREADAKGFYQKIIDSATVEQTTVNQQQGTLATQIDELQSERAKANGNAQAIADIDTQLNSLRAQLSQVGTTARNLDNEIGNAQRNLATRSPAAEVLRQASPASGPDGLPSSLLLIGGLLGGLLIGVVTAFLLERLDTTARDSEDVALALGATVMGNVPTLGMGNRGGTGSLIMLTTGGSARIGAAREAFRRLRSSTQFLNSSSGVSSIIVTSANPAEGKSLTSSNLAIALAQNGSRCVLVSADLRRPTLEKLFGMEGPRPGLSEYLAHAAELNAEKVPGIDNLWLIRSGAPPNNPGELLNSDRFEQMVKELEREDVEYIVIDTPPVLSTADALSAARYVDGVIVVVDTERTATSDLLQVRADLERTGAKLLGAVMNRQKYERGKLLQRDRYAYTRV
ncbi:MAG: polysaccharide biosynthesis tyrosine autokinase [Acidimicrobiales bacterium]